MSKNLQEQLQELAYDFWWTGDPWANDAWKALMASSSKFSPNKLNALSYNWSFVIFSHLLILYIRK